MYKLMAILTLALILLVGCTAPVTDSNNPAALVLPATSSNTVTYERVVLNGQSEVYRLIDKDQGVLCYIYDGATGKAAEFCFRDNGE